jgi:hypothetical protein
MDTSGVDKMDDEDPALGMKVRILFLITVIVLVVGSVSPAMVNKTEDVKPVSNISVGAKNMLINKGVPRCQVISGYFKPSVKGTGYSYNWHYKTWINQCPYCGHKLLKNPKGVPESELTCSKCDADYDGCSGYVKNGRKNKRLRRG